MDILQNLGEAIKETLEDIKNDKRAISEFTKKF